MFNRIIVPMMLTIVIIWTGAASESAWNLALDKDGIQVYTRPASGCPLNEFKGVAVINASLKSISAILRDVNAQPAWMADCLQSKLLKTLSKNRLVCYNVLHVGWPLSDRDLIIDVKFTELHKENKLVTDMTVFSEDIIPADNKLVRIRDFKASCIVEEISPGQCRVTYQNRVNPMAPVPDILANSIVKKNPFNTLKGMKRMASLEKYKN